MQVQHRRSSSMRRRPAVRMALQRRAGNGTDPPLQHLLHPGRHQLARRPSPALVEEIGCRGSARGSSRASARRNSGRSGRSRRRDRRRPTCRSRRTGRRPSARGRSAPSRRASRRTRRCRAAAGPPRRIAGRRAVAHRPPPSASARRRRGTRPTGSSPCMCSSRFAPARSCRSSTFWVTISSSPGHSASSRASAPCAALGSTCAEAGAAGVVEGVDQRRIARERLGRGDVLDPVPLPQPVGPAEGGEAAFGGDAGAGEDDDVADLAHAASLAECANVREGPKNEARRTAGPREFRIDRSPAEPCDARSPYSGTSGRRRGIKRKVIALNQLDSVQTEA